LKYDFTAIEKKWQTRWKDEKTFACKTGDSKPKFYGLVEFPYPSGAGLHVGHPRPYTAMDVIARKKRMDGYNVLLQIGYDAFGLPTENYAIKNHIHPAKVTHDNIQNFRSQLQMLGYSFDWDRVVDTTDPSYYKWTQWIFLQLYKHGLAYKTTMPVNWCTSCKCVLANEEVVEGVCERCGAPVVRKEKSQWMLKITAYAQKLIDGLDTVDFIERVKTQQRNWIGRSTGAEVTFKATTGEDIVVFTTRPDTLFGATYMVLSPEHELVKKWLPTLGNREEVEAYQQAAALESISSRALSDLRDPATRCDYLLYSAAIQDADFLERLYAGLRDAFREGELPLLLQTAECYYRHGRSVTQAASELFIHKNTLQYRVRRLLEALELERFGPFQEEFLMRLLLEHHKRKQSRQALE